MKQIKLNNLLAAIAFAVVLSSCHKDKIQPNTGDPVAERAGVYVLNQGNIGKPNSTLTYYDFTSKKVTADIFSSANGGVALGNTANDAAVYGSKMYLIVDVSSTIEVVNAKTAKSIKKISVKNGDVNREPRSVVFAKGKALITTYDGNVAVLDTASLEIEKYIKVGRNPEQMVVVGNKLYVANSGGLDFADPDKTVSVIDLTIFAETKKITVGVNPVSIAADAYGDVYVVSFGVYGKIGSALTIINTATDAVKSQNDIDAAYGTPIIIGGDNAYLVTADNKIQVYNVKNETVTSAGFITDGTKVTTPYSLNVDATTGELFVGDAVDYSSNGVLYVFDKTGKKEYSIATGINPGRIVLVNK